MEMLASFAGALIGGAIAILGGWLAVEWQARREARGVAAALSAELTVAQRMLEEGHVAELYQALLDQMKATGQVVDRQLLIDLFDRPPQDALPVYYSMAGRLGLLPGRIGSDVVEYHSLVIGLQSTIVRFLGKREGISKQTVKGLAASVETQWNKSKALRTNLITELDAISGGARFNKRKGLTRLGLALTVPYFSFWALTAWRANQSIPEYVALSRDAVNRGDWNSATTWMKASNEANAWVVKSLAWGVALPIAIIAIGVMAYWIYRGFRPKTLSDQKD